MDKKIIERKLLEIKDIVDKHTNERNLNYGLMGGFAGEMFFLYHYNKFYPGSITNFEAKIDCLLESVQNSYPYDISYCSGLAGLLYILEIMRQESFIDIELGDNFREVFRNLFDEMLDCGKYELLYGIMGICQLFCLDMEKYKREIELVINYLVRTKISVPAGYSWLKENKKEVIYDLSLSHGMSSIVVFLSRIINDNIFKSYREEINELLNNTVKFILSQQLDINTSLSYFPYCSNDSGPIENNSRLGWCYGDLSIGIALYQASIAIKDYNLTKYVNNIMLYAANNRKDLQENLVTDAGYCHGTSGIASIFYRMCFYENKEEYVQAANYWINQTIEMGRHENGLAGYLYSSRDHGFIPAYHLLEGISGIGLVLLYYLHNAEPEWDRCMLLV